MAFCKQIVSYSFMEMSSLSRSFLSLWTSALLKTSRRPLSHKHKSSRLSCWKSQSTRILRKYGARFHLFTSPPSCLSCCSPLRSICGVGSSCWRHNLRDLIWGCARILLWEKFPWRTDDFLAEKCECGLVLQECVLLGWGDLHEIRNDQSCLLLN